MTLKHLTGPLLGFATILCWSSYNVAAKHGIDTGISPQALTFLRFAVPGVIAVPLLLVLWLRGRSLGITLRRLAVLVLLGGPVFGLVAVSGYVHAPLSHGLLFAPVAVFVTTSVLGRILLAEPLRARRLAGAGIMFTGLGVLVGFGLGDLGADWGQGVVLFVAAGAMWGGYTVLLRHWRVPMIQGTVAVAAGSALTAIPALGWVAAESLLSAPTGALILQAVMQGLVGGVISVVALIGAVRLMPVQVAGLLPIFTPVVALALAAAAFGTMPTGAEIIGVTIIAAGFLFSFGVRLSQPFSWSQTGSKSRRLRS
ncbi:DMT family transporter [uncultured Tateyamaria sp.]|uniref:DMT family transporter n=1 Tax=uncultured Tateyamaria sp. TaxID=455651 RepID=UPI0026132EAC|nr:DMT family transporter [uncultured Tateyamaria sp.]